MIAHHFSNSTNNSNTVKRNTKMNKNKSLINSITTITVITITIILTSIGNSNSNDGYVNALEILKQQNINDNQYQQQQQQQQQETKLQEQTKIQVQTQTQTQIPNANEELPQSEFGKHLLTKFHLDDAYINLNHGSYGSVPKEVLNARNAYELQMVIIIYR